MKLPPDVLMSHILIRLPIKSLVYCMCVSKEWHRLLKSQTFAKLHLCQIANDDHQNKLLAQSTDIPCTRFRVIDCEALDSNVIRRPFPFKVSYTYMWFLSSCNGLIFVGLKKRMKDVKFSDLILWNPLTGDYKVLSKNNSPENVYDVTKLVFELYYNSCDDDYKLLHVTRLHDVYIYSLKSDSWRKIPNRNCDPHRRPGVCLNENLYFLKFNTNGGSFTSYSILRFDTKIETFTEIATPNFQNQCSSLTVERGCLHLCLMNHNRRDPYAIELWKMNGEDGGWIKVATYSPKKWINFHGCLQQLHLTRAGYWLMASYDGSICKVDLENRHKGKYFEYSIHGFCQVKRYIETFVSPNQYDTSTVGINPTRPSEQPADPPVMLMEESEDHVNWET